MFSSIQVSDPQVYSLFQCRQLRNAWTYLNSRFGDSWYPRTFVFVDWFHLAVLIAMTIGIFFAWKPYLSEAERARRHASICNSVVEVKPRGSGNRCGKTSTVSDASKYSSQIDTSAGASASTETVAPSDAAVAATAVVASAERSESRIFSSSAPASSDCVSTEAVALKIDEFASLPSKHLETAS